MNKKIIIVMWYAYSRRATSLSKELNAELFLLDTYVTKNPKFRKFFLWFDYLLKFNFTIIKLIRAKPELVIATSPPSLCPIACYFYCKIFNIDLIVDAHNSAFLNPWINVPLYKKVLRNSKKIIVHNLELYNHLSEKYQSFNFFLLPDPLPTFKESKNFMYTDYFLIICSFSDDEPIEMILDAVQEFVSKTENQFKFYVTGNYLKNPNLYKKFKNEKNILFLGFLDQNDYENYLLNAYGIITISQKAMVQQSAAIEALAAEVPFIIENSKTNRRLFYKGAILTDIKKEAIVDAIKTLIIKRDFLKKRITELKNEYRSSWTNQIMLFISTVTL